VAEWRLLPVVGALMTLRGIDLIAAVTLLAESGIQINANNSILATSIARHIVLLYI
jgi:hypothetical protein